jgi:tetratricopeptide (TPR) repeat protein
MFEFLISYAWTDHAWAEWIAWQLEVAGYATRLQALDVQLSDDLVTQMRQTVAGTAWLVAVLSPAYLASRLGEAQLRPVAASDPSGDRGLLVQVANGHPDELLAGRAHVHLVGLTEAEATERLLAFVGQRLPGRPEAPPAFLGMHAPVGLGVQPPFPGPGPSISNLAPRNPQFSGRGDLLDELGARLNGAGAAVAIHGPGGVGKSELALEYAHRHAAGYDLVWWVDSATRLQATSSLAELALRMGLGARAGQPEQAAAALAELARRDHWLLVFDSAEEPADLLGLWPSGEGQVVLTSRNAGWAGHASDLRVDVLGEDDAAAFLLERTGRGDHRSASVLAAELGGLPLALELAAAHLEQSELPLAKYLARYRRTHAQLLARGQPATSPVTVAATLELDLQWLAGEQAAVDMLRLCAFLGPGPIPPRLLAADPEVLPPELAVAVSNEQALEATVAALDRLSLVGRDHDGLRLHRLVGEVVRDGLNDQPWWAAAAVDLVAAGFPADVTEPASWPACARLLRHALATADHADRLDVAAAQTSRLLNRVGVYLDGRAEFAAAQHALERAVAIAEANHGPDHPTVATYVNNLGDVLRDLGDLAGARSHFERALLIDEAVYGPDDPSVAVRANHLGEVMRALGDLAGARALLERALRIDEATLGPGHPEVARHVNNLGSVLQDLGELARARTLLERALLIDEAAYGPDHPTVAVDVNNLGTVLREQGDLDGAKAHLKRALRIDEAVYGPDHPSVALRVNNLGDVLRQLGDLDGAKAYLERALRIDQAVYGPDHPRVAVDLSNLGRVLREAGDLARARSNYERALGIDQAVYGPDHPNVALRINNLGYVLQQSGDAAGARASYERALRILQTAYGPDHPRTRIVAENLRGLNDGF